MENLRQEETANQKPALSVSLTDLKTVLEALAVGILVVDESGDIMLANRVASEIYGYSEQELLNMNVSALALDPREGEALAAVLSRSILEGGSGIMQVQQITSAGVPVDTEWRWNATVFRNKRCAVVYIRERSNEKEVETALESERNRRLEMEKQLNGMLKELVRERAEARKLIYRDPLTGLYNRRFLIEQLRREIDRIRQERGVLSIAILDLDGFKSINDTHGHLVGDEVLRQFARMLERSVRKRDTVARFGGEEFIIVAPNVSEPQMKVMTNRLLKQVSSEPFQVGGKRIPVRFSAGTATFVGDRGAMGITEIEDRLLVTADRALYQAKESGRAQIRSGGPV